MKKFKAELFYQSDEYLGDLPEFMDVEIKDFHLFDECNKFIESSNAVRGVVMNGENVDFNEDLFDGNDSFNFRGDFDVVVYHENNIYLRLHCHWSGAQLEYKILDINK